MNRDDQGVGAFVARLRVFFPNETLPDAYVGRVNNVWRKDWSADMLADYDNGRLPAEGCGFAIIGTSSTASYDDTSCLKGPMNKMGVVCQKDERFAE